MALLHKYLKVNTSSTHSNLSHNSGNRIRFYAGVALRDRNGVALGSFCVLDRQPNQMTDDDMSLLKGLAADLMNTLSDENVKRKKCEEIQQLNDSSS